MRARRLTPSDLAALSPDELEGAVLLAPARLAGGQLRKGTRLDPAAAGRLIAAARAGELPEAMRLALPDAGDVHEDEAAERLARAAAGSGLALGAPRQSRLDLVARWDGVVHVRVESLRRLNTLDALEIFTLYHGQAVAAGEVVASVKVAPHVVPDALVLAGEAVAREAPPLVDVRPYVPLDVAAIAEEALSGGAFERFEAGVRLKVEALGSRFVGPPSLATRTPAPPSTTRGRRWNGWCAIAGCRSCWWAGSPRATPSPRSSRPWRASVAGCSGAAFPPIRAP